MSRTVVVVKAASPALDPLPEDHGRYFHTEQAHATIPLSQLTPTKTEPARSVVNAHRLMSQAYAGERDKRKPVTVQKVGKTYRILDGNATHAIAKQSGWSSLPVCFHDKLSKSADLSPHIAPNIQPPPHVPTPAAALAAPPAGHGVPYTPKPLFGQHELSMPKPYQAHDTPEAIWHHGTEANNHLAEALDRGAGLSTEHKLPFIEHSTGAREDLNKPGHKAILGRMKGMERAKEKVEGEQGGDWRGLTDVSRATVVGEHHADLHDLIHHTRQHMEKRGFQLVRAKDFYQNPTPAGYRGALTNWRHPNGHVAEVQFIDRHMLKAKEEGHKHYEQARSIAAGASNRDLTQDEQHKYDHHMGAMQGLYANAWSHNESHAPEAFPMKKAVSHAGASHRPVYFDFDGTPAYQRSAKAPAFGLFGTKWKPVNRAAIHHNSHTISRHEFDRLVAHTLRAHHGHS